MKSWIDLSKEEQDTLIKEFRMNYKGLKSNTLHRISVILRIAIALISIYAFMTFLATKWEDDISGGFFISLENLRKAKILVFTDVALIIAYISVLFNINKENKEFTKWLKTRNILK